MAIANLNPQEDNKKFVSRRPYHLLTYLKPVATSDLIEMIPPNSFSDYIRSADYGQFSTLRKGAFR